MKLIIVQLSGDEDDDCWVLQQSEAQMERRPMVLSNATKWTVSHIGMLSGSFAGVYAEAGTYLPLDQSRINTSLAIECCHL